MNGEEKQMPQDLNQKIKILEERLKEAEATIEAIRQGKIDAIVVQGEDKAEIYTLKGIDYTYRILIERMNEGAAILSKEGIVLFANNKLSEILGVEKNKFVGEFLDRFLVSSEKAKLNNLVKQALRDAVSEKIYYVRPADNQLKPLLFSANPMPSDTGGDVGLVVSDLSQVEEKEKLQKIQAKLEKMVIDRTHKLLKAHQELKIANEQLAREIEQHKLMEAELSKKEQEITQILNSLAEAVIGLDKSGNCIYANNSSLEVLGYQNRSQVLGKKLPEILFPELSPSSSIFKQCQQKIEELLKTGKIFTEELAYFKRVDGSEFPVGYVLHPIETEQGIQGAVISFISMAERMQLEKLLKTLSSVIEQSIDMVLITDKEGKIIYVNPAFEKTTGYSSAEIIGKIPKFLYAGRNNDVHFDEVVKRLKRGESWSGNSYNKKKSGEIFKCNIVIFPIKDDQGEIINYASIRRDVTKEEQLKEQVFQAQKMESLGKLTGGVAHDFNNLLTVINGFSKLAMELINKDHPVHNYLDQIYKAGERASHLTSQLLTFSRKQVMSPKKVNINQIFQDTQKMLRRLISEDIELIFKLDESVQPIKADLTQLDQILMNLVVNARDAILEKKDAKEKKIVVSTKQVNVSYEVARQFIDLQTGPHILIQVSDTGIGMPEDVMKQIFEPFFTTKKEGKGTGLGLATVYGIIKQNKASIQVKSKPGVGTTFSIYWPNYFEEETTDKKNAQQKLVSGKNQKILVVEDEDTVRELLTVTLKNLNYSVISASDGAQALDLLNDPQNKIDAVITDLVMPKMDGLTFAKKAKELGVKVPILFATGYADEHLEQLLNAEDQDLIIQKPYTKEFLSDKLSKVLGG